MESPNKQESDQRPEEAPPEQVPQSERDTARSEAEENAGVRDDPGQATGHPENAG